MSEPLKGAPEVARYGGLDMQVCVPAEWDDGQIVQFAEQQYPCGTEAGWQIRKEGSPLLKCAPERAPCKCRDGFVHVTLDA